MGPTWPRSTEIETNFGHDLSTSTAGAVGWMQFTPATSTRYQVSADPATPGAPPDPDDPWDAIFTAARYLHASGAPDDWPTALYAYNHAGWYVAQAGQLAQHYAQTAGSAVLAVGAPPAGCVTPGPPHQDRPRGSSRRARGRPAERAGAGAGRDRGRQPDHRHLLQHRAPAEHAQHRHGLTTTARVRPTSCSTTPALAAPRSTSATGSPATPPCSKPTATPDPAAGSPSTPPPTTPSSRSPGSCSTPPTGHQPPHPAADPAGNASTLPSKLADGNTWTQRHPPGL